MLRMLASGLGGKWPCMMIEGTQVATIICPDIFTSRELYKEN
jgi:hypothetical protein